MTDEPNNAPEGQVQADRRPTKKGLPAKGSAKMSPTALSLMHEYDAVSWPASDDEVERILQEFPDDDDDDPEEATEEATDGKT